MQRRPFLIALLAAPATAPRPSRLERIRPGSAALPAGTARKVAWRNPHAEFDLELAADLALPADLARAQRAGAVGERRRPATARRRAPADAQGPRLAHRAAPLTRLEAWKIAEIKNGDRVEVLGYTTFGEKGDPVLRAEYLFVDGRAYGLRSSPA
jgi:hypothetical protein